jgi:hypothetical protein
MPNWVYNHLTAIGSPTDVNACVAQLAKPYERDHITLVNDKGELVEERKTVLIEQDFSFWNIIRPSDEIIDEYHTVRRADNTRSGWLPEAFTAEGSLLEEPKGAPLSNHWYDWNIRNWGTKWDTGAELELFGDDHAYYRFETAWSPPVEAITALSAQYPGIVFSLEWEEEQGFGGEFFFRGGEVEVAKEWDIPDSHADNEERDRACVCEFEPDDQDYWYDDCPREVAA